MTVGSDQGWVEALPPEGDTGMVPQPPKPVTPPHGRIVAGLVLTVVAVVAVGVAAAWRSNASGDPMASARMMPADVDVALTVDVLQLGEGERLERLVGSFADPLHEAGVIAEPFDLVGAIDQAMGEELDLTLSDDVLSWIGRSATVGISFGDLAAYGGFLTDPYGDFGDLGEMPGFGEMGGFADLSAAPAARAIPAAYQVMPEPGVLVTAAVRDHAAAAVFVDKIVALTEDTGVAVTPRTAAGFEGYEFVPDVGFGSQLIVLTDDMLLAGPETMVTEALEMDGGAGSLAEDAGYVAALQRLPQDRMVTMFVDMGFLEEMVGGAFDMGMLPAGDLGSYALSLGVVDEGVRLDFGYAGPTEPVAAGPDLAVLESLPSDVIAFFSARGGGAGDDLAAMDPTLQYELDQLSAEFEAVTGVGLLDLLDSFSGSITLAVTETREGSIARETTIPIGVVGAVGLDDRRPIEDLLASFQEQFGVFGVEMVDDGDLTTLRFGGSDVASLSLDDDQLVVGSGPELVGAVANGTGEGITRSALYRELDGLVVGDGLSVYLDVSRLAGLVPLSSDERAIIEQVRGVGGGVVVDRAGSTLELMILIDY
jgi:hypothetical protein